MNKYLFTIINPADKDWEDIESCPDCTVFHTRQWNLFLERLGRKQLVVSIAQIGDAGTSIGYFEGTKRWLGIKVLGSPSGSTGTFVQGLCLKKDVSQNERLTIYKELVDFLVTNKVAGYIQISDWHLSVRSQDWIPMEEWRDSLLNDWGIFCSFRTTYYVDTTISEEQLWSNLKYKSCKYAINKARKNGLLVRFIEKEEDIPGFVDVLSSQIKDVSKRKNEKRHAHHKKRCLMELCKALFPDRVLMVQVVGKAEDGEEHIMSSAIFCVGKAASTYYSGASNEKYMKYCPNELMVWEAMRRLHDKGAGDLIMGGTAAYKKKFGPSYAFLPMMVFTKYKFLRNTRVYLKKCYKKMRNISFHHN